MGATASNLKNGRSGKGGKPATLEGWQGYVDIPLTEEDKQVVAQLCDQTPEVGLHFLLEVLEDGYKISLSPDPKHNCIVSTLTGKVPGNPNEGFSMSARGPDGLGALMALRYKHVILSKSDKWDDATQQRSLPGYG